MKRIFSLDAYSFLFLLFFAGISLAVPPIDIPSDLYDDYTLNGVIPIGRWYRDDSYESDNPLMYSKLQIDANMEIVRVRGFNYYGETDGWLYKALEKYIDHIEGKEVGIIGSAEPWYESVSLFYGAKPITIEYNKIITDDERIRLMTVKEYEESPFKFDTLISISTYEHDGLGRYGDSLDPYGDIKAMQKARNMLNEGGLLFLSVPVGQDRLVWNVHRIYGRIRLAMLLTGWELVDSFGFNETLFNLDTDRFVQPIFVLRKNS